MSTIFDISESGRRAHAQRVDHTSDESLNELPRELLRQTPPVLPEVSELQAVRHYTNLSRKNFSIDTQFYPLGSCTMKYNPRGAHKAASLPGFLGRHPLAPEASSQGYMACLYDLQEILKDVTGMQGVSLTPMAGAQGEFAGVAMIRAYHEARSDHERTEILVPSAAHGPNPATAVRGGKRLVQIHVQHVNAHVAGFDPAEYRGEIGAVVVEQPPGVVDDVRNLPDVPLEHSQRRGVGQHQAGGLGAHHLAQ